jgi:hypothetical protein
MPDIIRFISHVFLFVVGYLVVKVPLSVALKLSLSLDPAVVDLIENEPVTLSEPLAPANLPVPLTTVAVPVTATVVGAAESDAQALLVVASVSFRVLPPPLKMPVPLIGSQVLVGADDPDPLTLASPSVEPVPVPVSAVTLTSLALQSSDIVPEYEPENLTVDVVTGFLVVHPAGQWGETATILLISLPL